ncbi:MAG: Asp23/Gls24 family envelope stress response protein [Clostridiales bacterium]|nr:Asp23/Gls24 family envelope stress response protein [Clostridiales bacterium]
MERKTVKPAGSLKVSDEVIIRITEVAATEIAGVAAEGQKLVPAENSLSIPMLSAPIRVNLTAESAEITLSIVIESGYNANNVAKAVQKSVKSAVQSMTGIAVSKVNVVVAGIKFKKESE